MISLISLSIVLFCATHIDDLVLLISFFADRGVPRRSIVSGQYIGVTALLLGSLLCTQAIVLLPPIYLRLLGLVPLAIGIGKLPALFRDSAPDAGEVPPTASHSRHMWGVAALTMASGGDNLGVYLPFFATHPPRARLTIIVVFLAMTSVWCYAAYWLATHRLLQPVLRRWGARLVPIVLIGLGLHILLAWP